MMSFRSIFALAFVLFTASAFMATGRHARNTPLKVLSDPRSEADLAKTSEQFLANLQNRAEALTGDAKKAVLAKLESKEFQDDVKAAPARAFAAMKGFVESDEVKSASQSAVNAFKAALESDEVKALKNRANQAVKEAMKKKA
jgi:hypothetical protein